MSEWKEYKTTDLLDQGLLVIGDGYRAKNIELSASKVDGLPFARVGNINGGFNFHDADYFPTNNLKRVGEKISKVGDVVFTSKGTVGRFAYVNDKSPLFVYSPQLCFWRSTDQNFLSPLFLFYWMQSREFFEQADAVKSQTDMADYVNLSDQRKMKITLPEINEQTAIAAILSSLDDKIDLLHRQNTTLEKMAETLFRQWFVEEAKEEWETGKVSDLIKILSGFAFKSSSLVESGKYRLITIKGVQDGYLELNNADKIEELPDRMPDFCKLQIGDILLSLTGNVGRCCLVDTTDLLLNQRVAKLHPINERDRAYTYFLFRQPQIKQLLEEMGKGTAQSNLSPIETSTMELIIPDKEKLTKFSRIATPWLNKMLFNKKSIQTLSQLRDSLLPKLMNGEVTINTN